MRSLTDLLLVASLAVGAGVIGFYIGGKMAIRYHKKNLEDLRQRRKASKNSGYLRYPLAPWFRKHK